MAMSTTRRSKHEEPSAQLLGRVERVNIVSIREIQVTIASNLNVIQTCLRCRAVAEEMGFTSVGVAAIVAATSEMLRNTVKFAGNGKAVIKEITDGIRRGLHVTVADNGPGIPDIERAMQKGFTTGKSLGLGLPGCQRLMDEFEIESQVGRGTVIRMAKWLDR
jgi:serine/threonine-protein kinase RsbT